MIPQRQQQTAQTDIWEAERKTKLCWNSAANVSVHLSLDFRLYWEEDPLNMEFQSNSSSKGVRELIM